MDGILDGTNPKADARLARDIAGAAGHTPGPWHLSSKGDGRTYVEGGDTADDIACLLMDHAQSENNANARLIAAAPDMALMLDAIRFGVVDFYRPTGELRFNGMLYAFHDNDWSRIVSILGRDELRAAIRKAGGAA